MNLNSRVFIAGHNGLVGSSVLNALRNEGFTNFILLDRVNLDLRSYNDVEFFFSTQKPDVVVLAAAKVGGILANINYPVDFLLENLKIQNNVISCANKYNVEKLIFIASSCIYPTNSRIPIDEDQLLGGKLEETNKFYAISKLAGISLCDAYHKQYNNNFISILPTNLYGPGDNFNLSNGHVLPSLVRKFYEAKNNNHDSVEVWGSGNAFREFLHVNDLASAIVVLLKSNNLKYTTYNIGYGTDIKIKDLAIKISKIIGYSGNIKFNSEMPDGVYRKLLDSSRIRETGWSPIIDLDNGIRDLILDYSKNHESYRG